MSSKKWFLGVTVVALAIMAISFLKLGDNLVYFYTPKEAVASANELSQGKIRVGGMVQADTVVKDDNLDLSFVMTDMNGTDILVHYRGSPPDLFKEGQGVVVEGLISSDGRSMQAQHLYVKHSEEYRTPHDPKSMDSEYLQKSLFKNQEDTP